MNTDLRFDGIELWQLAGWTMLHFLWLGTLIGTQIPFLETRYAGDFDALFVEVYRVVMWLSWVPNLIVAEMIIQRRRTSQLTLELQSVSARLQSSSS